ncbi:unnamed protein product [Auanema sp. JU1783]|nr:unnamed protein product [Auanema sp. JU1783]
MYVKTWIFTLFLIDICTCLPSIVHTAISCDKTDFLLKIQFNETFSGTIFTEKGEPNCVYLNASIQQAVSYDVKIPLTGCETRRNGEGNLENEIVVQSTNSFNSAIDKRYLLTCIPANPIFRDSQVTVSFGGITVDTSSSTAATLISSPKIDYQVVVRDGDDFNSPPLNRPLAVGDRVTYTVHLTSGVRGRIGRCWASDGKSELELSSTDGCSVQKSGEVWGDFDVSRDESGTLFMNHIKAWAFPTSNEVNIFCNLHICADCEQSTCTHDRNRRYEHSVLSRRELSSERRLADDVMDDEDILNDTSPPISLRTSFRLRRQSRSSPKANVSSLASSSASASTSNDDVNMNLNNNLNNLTSSSTHILISFGLLFLTFVTL